MKSFLDMCRKSKLLDSKMEEEKIWFLKMDPKGYNPAVDSNFGDINL